MRRALVLAAGLGRRLRPLTLKIPKCLLPVDGRPLMDIWLEACRRGGIAQVLVNTHHLAGHVNAHLSGWSGPPAVRTAHEEMLLGSAGTLSHNRRFFEDGSPFAVIYADTLAPCVDLDSMFRFHRDRGGLLTMGLFRTGWPRECGIVEMSGDGRILSFTEKPKSPGSDLANAGIYVAEPAVLDLLPETVPADFGHDFLPSLVGRMFGFPIDGPVLDIGTPARYREALRVARKLRLAGQTSRARNRPPRDRKAGSVQA